MKNKYRKPIVKSQEQPQLQLEIKELEPAVKKPMPEASRVIIIQMS